MNDRTQFRQLAEEVSFVLALRRSLHACGVHLIVEHRNHERGTFCAPGEMVGAIWLGGIPEPVPLVLAPMSLILTDCLCRHRMPITALRIEQIMKSDPFYVHYGTNIREGEHVIRRPDRRTVKVYVGRIREQMKEVFEQVGLSIDPRQVLTSEVTDSNVVVYRLRATVEVVHVDY
jgi:hypothetical protein